MARVASLRSVRKYKPVGPVGAVPPLHVENDQAMRMRTGIGLLLERDFAACSGCGYHVCSCKRQTSEPDAHGMGLNSVVRGLPRTIAGRMELLTAFQALIEGTHE